MSEEQEKKAVQPQVLVLLRDGNKVTFDVENYERFVNMRTVLNEFVDNALVFLGPNCLMRRDAINGFYYFPEGYEAAQKQVT